MREIGDDFWPYAIPALQMEMNRFATGGSPKAQLEANFRTSMQAKTSEGFGEKPKALDEIRTFSQKGMFVCWGCVCVSIP